MPGAPSSFLFLVVRPGVPSSFEHIAAYFTKAFLTDYPFTVITSLCNEGKTEETDWRL